MLAALPAAALASPAHADDDSNFGLGVNAADNWNSSAAAVCFQELAVSRWAARGTATPSTTA